MAITARGWSREEGMKKRVFIIHGWSGRPNEHWLPWLKNELEAKGFEVEVPLMLDHDDPIIDTCVKRLGDAIGASDENTYFVGHSIGCQTIMRYLASRDEKAGGCVFVAGWFKMINLEDKETEDLAAPWMDETTIDFNRLRKATDKFTVLISDNDDYDRVDKNRKLFEEKVGAKVTIMHDKGHFTAGDGVTELPEALTAVLDQAQ